MERLRKGSRDTKGLVTKRPQDYLLHATPFEIALFSGSIDCAELIISKLPNTCRYINPAGLSALSIGIKSYSVVLLDILDRNIRVDNTAFLLKAGADVNPQPVSETPLQSAAKALEVGIIAKLLHAGAFVNEVADDSAVINSINQDFTGKEEERLEALRWRGFDDRYKTPCRILLDHISEFNAQGYDRKIAAEKAVEMLRVHGGLSLCLFPVKDLPGYQVEDWKRLEVAGWQGVRG
jgi:hypothetical protein